MVKSIITALRELMHTALVLMLGQARQMPFSDIGSPFSRAMADLLSSQEF